MKKVLILIMITFFAFLFEFVVYNLGQTWLMPNVLILLIVFFTYNWGIRYSLIVALTAGLIRDSFSSDHFGLEIFSFVACAYAAVFIKRYLFHISVQVSRLLMIFFLIVLNFTIHLLVRVMTESVDVLSALKFILVPQLIVTLLVSNYILKKIKTCVLKLSV